MWWTKRQLKSSNPHKRERAVRSLAANLAKSDNDSVELLVGALNDDSPSVRKQALKGLAGLNNPLISKYMWAVITDRDASVRVEALRVLNQALVVEEFFANVGYGRSQAAIL